MDKDRPIPRYTNTLPPRIGEPGYIPDEPTPPPILHDKGELTCNKHGGKQSKIHGACSELPPYATLELSRILEEGARKYGSKNWHKISVLSEIDHALNHIFRFLAVHTTYAEMKEHELEDLSHGACRMMMALDQYIRESLNITPEVKD